MSRLKKGQASQKKELFLTGALRSIERVGIHQMNSYTVAKEIGVSQPSFFYYFESQQEFYRELVQYITRINEEVVRKLTENMARVTAWERLETYIAGNLLWTEKFPAQFDVLAFGMQECAQDKEIIKLINAAFAGGQEKMYNIIAGGYAEGQFSLKLPIQTAVFTLHKCVVGSMFHLHNHPEKPRARAKIQEDILTLAKQILIA